MILAAVFVAASALLARLFAAKSETILAPFVRNILLRSVIGSVISSLLVIGGLMLRSGAAADAPCALNCRRGVDRGSGCRLCLPRHHGKLHRFGLAGLTPAIPDRRLHHGRRPGGRGPVIEHPCDRTRDARWESRTHSERHGFQGDHDQFDGLAQLPEQLRRRDPK